jgi:hypothetical protein
MGEREDGKVACKFDRIKSHSLLPWLSKRPSESKKKISFKKSVLISQGEIN